MDRNLLLAVTLSVAVYAAWFGFIEKKVNPQPVKPAVSSPAGFAPGANVRAANPPVASSTDSPPAPTASAKLDAAQAEEVQLGDAIA